jgi:hypothetical protein
MTLFNQDLKNLNFQFLMVVRECARHQPMDAIWKFNLNAEDIEKISTMTIEELKEIAACSRAVFTLLPVRSTSSDITSSILAALMPVTVHA